MVPRLRTFPSILVLFAFGISISACGDSENPLPSGTGSDAILDASANDAAVVDQGFGDSIPADIGIADAAPVGTLVTLNTSKGKIVIELDDQEAPITVANFLSYVDKGHYAGTIFHRVIPGFMVQGGGFDETYSQKSVDAPITNEAGNGLRNLRGTLAMARTSVVNSATSQFFINIVDNPFLDHKDETNSGFGYAVFGKVIEGMAVVDSMAVVDTGAGGPFKKDVPVTQIVIQSATR
jgi:peptidyl-prolyl cis-trans isomerase B (cyclophilin B)